MSDRKEFYLNISPRDLRRSPGEKALGRSLGSMGRTLKATTAVFNPNAWDGDNDGLVQDSTPFERPAIPGVNDFFTRGVVDADKATEAWRSALEQRRAPGSGTRSVPRPSDGIASIEDAIAKIRKHRTIDYKYGDDSILGKQLRAYDPSWLDGLSPKQISQLVVPSSEDDLYEILLDYNLGKDYGDGLRKAAALRLLKRAYKREQKDDSEIDFSPESVQQMREIVEQSLDASPAFLYSVQKFGMPAVLKYKDREDGDLIAEVDGRFGQIYFYPDFINNDLHPILPNDESVKGDYIIDRSILSTLTHEYAHFLHYQVLAYDEIGTSSIGKIDRPQMRTMVQIARKYEGSSAFMAIDPDSEELPDMASMPDMPLVKSVYSHTNKEETFAEGFSAFMHPNADIRENSINDVMRRDLEAFLDQRIMPRDDQSAARMSSSGRRDRRVNAGNQRLEMVRPKSEKESDNSKKLARRLEIENSGVNSSLLLEDPNSKAPSIPRLSSAGTNVKRDLSRGSIKETLRDVEITTPHLSHVDDREGDELRLIADVHQIGDEKVIFGYFTKTQKKNMSLDGVKIVPINPYEISGYEQTSEEGRKLARTWAFARAYAFEQDVAKGKYDSTSTDIEALLYAASRGDSEAMEKLEEMASIAETAVAKRREDAIAENFASIGPARTEYLSRAAKDLKLDNLTIDGLMLVHETKHPPRYDEDGNIILNPAGDWPAIQVGEGTDWDASMSNSDSGGYYQPRNTLHFHLNGLAQGHMLRQRQGGYVIIVPLKQVLDANPGSLDNLYVIDTWLTPKPGEPLRIPGARVLDQGNLPTFKDLGIVHHMPDEKADPDSVVHAVVKELGGQPFSSGEMASQDGQDWPVFNIAQSLGVTAGVHNGTPVYTKEKQVRPVDSAPMRQSEPKNILSISYRELSEASDNQILRIANDDRFTGYKLQYERRGDDLFLASRGGKRNARNNGNDAGILRSTRAKGYGDQADRVALFSGKKYQEIVDKQPPLNSEQKNTASEIKSIVSTPALSDVDLYDVSTDAFGQEQSTLLDSEERIEAKKKIRAAVTTLFTNTLELDKPLVVKTEDGEEISLGRKIRITPRNNYSALTGNGVKIEEVRPQDIKDQAAEMLFDPLFTDETTKIMSISINFSIDIPEDETLEFDVENLPVSHPLHRYKKTEYDEKFRIQRTNTLKVGTGTRTLIGTVDKDGNFQITTVLHDSLTIDKGLKGGGIGTIINAKNETIYKELGVKRILTQGLSSNDFGQSSDPWSGASHWPKNGFTWAGERGKQEFIAIIHDAITNNSGKYFAPGEKEKISKLYTFDEATGTFTTDATPEELLKFKYSTELFMDKNASIFYERRLTSSSQSGAANNLSGIAKDMDLNPSLSRVGLKSSGRRVPKNVKRDLVAGSLSKKSETVSGDKYTASIYSVDGKKIAFGIRDKEAAGIPDDVEVITMNPYIISGHEQTSIEGREFAYKWVMAKSAAMYGDDERITPEMKENRATHVDALLYAASRGDSSAMEELEMLSSIGEKMAQEERRRFESEELEPQKKMWSRELSDLTEEEQLALPSIDDIYVIHQTVHPIVKDENGDIVIRPNGDWQHEKPDGSEAESFRDSVHFAINHVVSGHMFRERPENSNIIVVPLREFLAANPDSVDGVNTVDTWATPKPGEPIKIPTATSKVFENVKAEKGEQKNGEADTLVEDYLRGEALKRTRERHKNEMIEQWRREGLSDERIEILSDPGNLKYERTESGLSYNYVPQHTYLDSTPESAGTDRFNAYLKQMMLEQYGVVWMMPHMGSPQEILEDATSEDMLESERNSGVFSPQVLGRVSRNQILRIGDSGRLHGVSKVAKERTQSTFDDEDDE